MVAYHLPESLYVAMSVEAAARLCDRGVLSVALVTAAARHSSDEICSWDGAEGTCYCPVCERV